MVRRCVWSRNIKNRRSIYIYDISSLRVKNAFRTLAFSEPPNFHAHISIIMITFFRDKECDEQTDKHCEVYKCISIRFILIYNTQSVLLLVPVAARSKT